MALTKHGHVCENFFSCDFWVFGKTRMLHTSSVILENLDDLEEEHEPAPTPVAPAKK
jgi:hypothetical protein